MRRNDREISGNQEVEEIIQKADVCRLAFATDNVPYIVTMNFGYVSTLYKCFSSIALPWEKNSI